MKHFPLKTAVLCLILTPVLYAVTLVQLESWLTKQYQVKLGNRLMADTAKALEGEVAIEVLMAENIRGFLDADPLIRAARFTISVIVTTQDGWMVFPVRSSDPLFQDGSDREPARLAKRNYDLLNQGFRTIVEIRLEHGSRLANLVLMGFLSLSLAVFGVVYRKESLKQARESAREKNLVKNLENWEQTHKKQLGQLETEKKALCHKLEQLEKAYQADKEQTRINEEEMVEEIIQLEEEKNEFTRLKQEMEAEIALLENRIERIERRKGGQSKRNEFEFVQKRFAAVYKQVEMHRKAVAGFLALNEDQQIKAEEVVSQLDRTPDLVTIKRKVFSGKKHKTTVLEVLFAYNGRLYFRLAPSHRIEVLLIGTKKTQAKDMEFLHRL